MNESREWIFHPLSTWTVLCNGGGLFRWQVGHISVAYFFFLATNICFYSCFTELQWAGFRIRVSFDCKQQISTKHSKQKTSHVLVFKKTSIQSYFKGIRAKHSASSLRVFVSKFCLSPNASLSWLDTSFFPRVRHLWIRCIFSLFDAESRSTQKKPIWNVMIDWNACSSRSGLQALRSRSLIAHRQLRRL